MTSPHDPPAWRVALDRTLFVAVIGASFVVLFAPSPPSPPLFPYADKVIHCGLFAALAWSGRRAGLPTVVLALVLVAYAAGSEVIQATVIAERSGDWTDVVADLIGVAVGLAVARWTTGAGLRASPGRRR